MFFTSLFKTRSRHEKAAESYRPLVNDINALGPQLEALSDDELRSKVVSHKGKDWEEIERNIPEIAGAIREAGKRILGMRHFDVQLMGGLALLQSNIAEMKTGEGKTLVATIPLTIRALAGKGTHLVTVNEYLARRDADWMRPLYEFFGLSVGVILSGQTPEEKRKAYAADITYGTNNEFGFDYLRDNMAQRMDQLVQRDLYYVLLDEVDSILIDEARTPLIISAPDVESTELYQQFARIVPQLSENTDYNIDEKRKAATLTDDGISHVEKMLGIDNMYAEKGIRFVHHLEQALRARAIYHKDKEYIIQDGKVVIVDEFTGRLMPGRRFSEGLHQALEAKEGVPVQQESRTLASVTFQNFFRQYEHMAGMTGTAVTSAEEFEKVYNLDVVVIPTNNPMVRQDKPDRIYVNEEAKNKAVVEEIRKRHEKGQPVLVGTIAIEKSEYLSAYLTKEGVPHEVLNAKHHEREAEIISQAGQKDAVTISTNMAGRGTDIKLGDGVAELGGLYVIGTERHEARRIDNQLRGRSGRQGDPGETQFFVSLDDDVMRVFGGNKIQGIMQRLKLPENEPIQHKMVSRAIEKAQERVEGHYFDMRKQVLSYDDVMNRQRKAIYALRRSLLQDETWKDPNQEASDLYERIQEMLEHIASGLVSMHTSQGSPDQWNIEEIAESIHSLTNTPITDLREALVRVIKEHEEDALEVIQKHLTEFIQNELKETLEQKRQGMGEDTFKKLMQAASLRSIDMHWMEHLDTMDYLRTGIGLRGYGQRDPLVEYQKEAHHMFKELLETIQTSLVETLFRAQAVREEQTQGVAQHESTTAPHRIAKEIAGNTPQQPSPQPSTDGPLHNPYKGVGRNDSCPCGSGKKFKKCHGT